MSDTLIVTIFGFIVMLVAVMTPVVKLTSNISEIKTILQRFEEEYKENHKKLEARVDKHGNEIDELKETIVEHDVRLDSLEKG